ncbi:MAG TPA: hypothetical protein PKA98_16135, partial [Acidimicrobiales bacterium]|nr:hypothetical protein [Acidimicrobiales bacterium]
MLSELRVTDLGVIAELTLVFPPGMIAVTGETGAGKTLVVGAIDLLVGGRADPTLVRPGVDEARVEGRFLRGDEEVVLARVIPREGRSRAYVDGRLATVGALAEIGAGLVDLPRGRRQGRSAMTGSEWDRLLPRLHALADRLAAWLPPVPAPVDLSQAPVWR